jgi:hypothetical protein
MKTDPCDPRVMSGAIWTELCDALKRAEGLVLADHIPDSPRMRAGWTRR